jgi:hypothetical protein
MGIFCIIGRWTDGANGFAFRYYTDIYIWPQIDSRLNDAAWDELKAGYKLCFWNSEKTPEGKTSEVNFPSFCWIH